MTHKTLFLCLAVCLVLLFGCDSSVTELEHKESSSKSNVILFDHPKHSPSYQKPGANIRLSHNYDGNTVAGEVENIQLTFSEQYTSGQIYIRLKPEASLSIEPATREFSFSMDNQNLHTIELSISASTEGKHLLNLFASVVDETGRVRNRIMAVAFYVGDNEVKQSNPQVPTSNDKVIILPSLESGSRP